MHDTSKTLLVFTGGGVAPALNATLYGVITEARKHGFRILGGIYGWASLLPGGRIADLTNENIESLRETGGTILRTSRTNPFAVDGGVEAIKETMKKEGIDALLPIGGDDTLGATKQLVAMGVPAVGIPKTIDNDLSGTYWSPGFPTAAHRVAEFMRMIRRDASYPMRRIYIVEWMGMHSGWVTCAGALGGADLLLPPEFTHDADDIAEKLVKIYEKNDGVATVSVSENASFVQPIEGRAFQQKDMYGRKRNQLVALALRDYLQKTVDADMKVLIPGNYVSSGPPVARDRDRAIELGRKAVELVAEERFGFMPCIERVGESNEVKVSEIPLAEVVGDGKVRKLDESLYAQDTFMVTEQWREYMKPIVDSSVFDDTEYDALVQKVK